MLLRCASGMNNKQLVVIESQNIDKFLPVNNWLQQGQLHVLINGVIFLGMATGTNLSGHYL